MVRIHSFTFELRTAAPLLARLLAAIAGGYSLANLLIIAIAAWLPNMRDQAVLSGILISFAVFAGVVVWAFAARSALHCWAVILLLAAILGLLSWIGFSLFGTEGTVL